MVGQAALHDAGLPDQDDREHAEEEAGALAAQLRNQPRWLALNMMTEGRAGFRAFNEGPPAHREVDFVELRRRLARGEPWDDDLTTLFSRNQPTRLSWTR